ncbi:endo alpha-1,4 polygalactosaminidase [Sphingobium estronivorans]|uniref:endo alpha-1,4 polygalactosaminidase n=1 Tax=Sphingobium estronivorans TaxID=1577690 RepID=UPI00123B16E6|nr:endo alpha-1,4 polygalactosaminidase [Sphingobium estronivorans]
MNHAFRRRDLFALSLMVFGLSARALPQSDHSSAWGLDYGGTTDPAMARRFELLVLEPDFPRPIAPLRGQGSRLLGYISLGEVHGGRPFIAELEKAGALRQPNPNWPDARLVDLRDPAWTKLVLGRLVPAILQKGYDGIFMDTLDNAEAMERQDPERNKGMIAGAARLVAAIRKRFPGITIMMNRGYALLPAVATEIDLVLAEAMASRWNFNEGRYEMTSADDWAWQAGHLLAARQVNPRLTLATLDYWDPQDAATVASLYARERAAGFQPYVSTLALDRLIAEPQA